jgi:hypothetical protein
MNIIFDRNDRSTARLWNRSHRRLLSLLRGTQKLREHFEVLGDTPAQSKSKINQLSDETANTHMRYMMGNRQPLLDAINASNGNLAFMNAAAKTVILDEL